MHPTSPPPSSPVLFLPVCFSLCHFTFLFCSISPGPVLLLGSSTSILTMFQEEQRARPDCERNVILMLVKMGRETSFKTSAVGIKTMEIGERRSSTVNTTMTNANG